MHKSPARRRATFAINLLTGTALVSAALVGAAHAQAESEAIVVTGSSIRGAPPVGSNLINVGRQQIEETAVQTVQQLLKTVPAIVGLQSAGQGAFGSADGAGTNAPTIHGLGASASNSTLILVDGHRFPLSGLNHTLGDPNIIPPNAIERVEVLPDGASSVYGSDAVAGVVNFITRRRFDGVEVNAQTGFGEGYNTYSGGIVGGKTWEGGSALAAYGYSERSALSYRSRADWIDGDNVAQGGTNFRNLNCPVGAISASIGGVATAWQYPYTTSFANTNANQPCFSTFNSDILPKESRHSTLVKVSQELTDKLTVSVDTVFSDRRNEQRNSRGTTTQTVTTANPFFTRPAGTTLTSESVSIAFDDLLGPGAYTAAGEQTWYIDPKVEYELTDTWTVSASALFGHNTSFQTQFGAICTSCVQQRLTGAALTSPTGVGTPAITLTTANALDPFNPLGSNRNAGILSSIIDTPQSQISRHTIQDYRLQLGGDLFSLPGGPVKLALGGEFVNYTLTQDNARSLNIGRTTAEAGTFLHLDYQRDVKSAFAEILLPLVGPDQGIPGIYKLDVNASARYDDYNDCGDTSNPKIGVNWELVEGLKFRGSYAKSFVAPALTSFGADGLGTTSETSFTAATLNFNVPRALYPTISSIPGINCGTATCTQAGTGALAVNGIQINGGNNDLKPQKGTTWALGADYNPSFIPGLRTSVTFWHNEIEGAVTAPTQSIGVNVPSLAGIALQVFPTGMTPAQIAAAQGNRPAGAALSTNPLYFVYDFRQRNVLNLEVEGVDAEANYTHDMEWGSLSGGVSVSRKTKFDQSFGNSPSFSVLGSSGFNTTFPSIKTDVRGNLGVDVGPLSGRVFVNYTGPFSYWGTNTVTPITRDANNNPSGGGDTVDSYTTFDLNVGYKFGEAIFGQPELFLDVTNVTDERPPFENVQNGFDTFAGNPIGRVTTVGLRAKF